MAYAEKREHERIDIQMATRMWLDESYKGKAVLFEGFCQTKDLAIGGTFIVSSYLLPVGFPLNLQMRIEDDQFLFARGEVVHRVEEGGKRNGMGIAFTEVDAENRERLLRFFVSDRIREFYATRFIVEFPHLETVLSLKDIALVINLWEDREERLKGLHKPTDASRAASRKEQAAAAQRRGGKKR